MVDTPVRRDALCLQLSVVAEQVVERGVGIRDVIDADHAGAIVLRAFGLQHREVGEGESVVLVVVGQECERRVAVLHFAPNTVWYQRSISSKRRVR